MTIDIIIYTILLSPIAFALTAGVSWFQPGLRPRLVKRLAVASTVMAMIIAVTGSIGVVQNGLIQSGFIGFNHLGLSIRLDSVSMIMFSMIAIIAFVVVRFSLNYLDGDANQGRFIGRLAATIASVQLLVLSGNLGLLLISWILTSNSLHRLLVFYRERPGAIIAARKKFIMARLGDTALLGAVVMLYFLYDTGNLEQIFTGVSASLVSGTVPMQLEIAAILLALAAILKSAQFPTHGWLIEVMETPTPVSALLHAGLLNAGPFLLIRMAHVMEATTVASILIIAVGGFTALFASLSFLTQTSVKTALGYSSVAHMGFSLMVCGLGVFPAAMLHLVAHSFYKAHAFLSSGSVIEQIRAAKVQKAVRLGSPWRMVLSIVLAVAVYTGIAYLFGVDLTTDIGLLMIGAIIAMGMSTLFATAIDSDGGWQLILRAVGMVGLVALAFFTLESGMHLLLNAQLPASLGLSAPETGLVVMMLTAFAMVSIIQIAAPGMSASPAYRTLALHFRNGFYVNAMLDRVIGSWRIHDPEENPVEVEVRESLDSLRPIEVNSYEKQSV